MNSPYDNGIIRQQEIAQRNIARQRIAEAIARETQRTGILLDLTVEQIQTQPGRLYNVAQLWDVIQGDEGLSEIKQKADRNASDYPSFQPWITSTRRRLEESSKARLRKAVLKPNYQSRFRNTVGFKPALAA